MPCCVRHKIDARADGAEGIGGERDAVRLQIDRSRLAAGDRARGSDHQYFSKIAHTSCRPGMNAER